MSFSLIAFIKAIILPPTLNFVFIVTGLLFRNKNKLFSQLFIYTGGITLILFSLIPVANFFIDKLERYPALELPIIVQDEKAIVVLSGGVSTKRIEYGREIDGAATLQRSMYAVFLSKQVNLPVLLTGGLFNNRKLSEAAVMAETLENSFNVNVNVKWLEEESKNTAENAIYSAKILRENNIDSIFLVTHAWHMPRAVMMFEQEGIKVRPAPTIFNQGMESYSWKYFIPSLSALTKTKKALHEYIGMLWYKLNY